jgi:hypothetical protein
VHAVEFRGSAIASIASLALLASLASVACGYPSFDFLETDDTGVDAIGDTFVAIDTHDDSTSDGLPFPDTAVDGAKDTTVPFDTPPIDTAPCPILVGGDVCTSIPKFTAKDQVLDGDGSEFCDIPATKLVATSGADLDPSPPPSGIDTVVLIRVAWSSIGMHVHVHVDQASVYAPSTSEPTWAGDALELYAAGFDMLTGAYDGSTHDPGAMQIIATPPDPSRGIVGRSELWQEGLIGAYAKFASRLVPGGYEEEFELPWSDLHATSPTSGTGVAFDLAVDVRQSASVTKGPLLQSFLYFTPDVGSTVCDPTTRPNGHPSCDDKTWCKTKLE